MEKQFRTDGWQFVTAAQTGRLRVRPGVLGYQEAGWTQVRAIRGGANEDSGESHTKSQRAGKLGQEENLETTQLKIRTIETKQEAQANRSYQFILFWCPADGFTNILRLIMAYFRAWSEKKLKNKKSPRLFIPESFSYCNKI